jgi:hypothetical protein
MTNSIAQLQQQYEGSRLAAAAYGAEQFKALLATSPSSGALTAGVESILVQQGFSPAQASSFVEKYTPVAALDQDGAGAVLFRVNGTDSIATAVRGTDTPNTENRRSDLIADGTIAQNQLPVYQTTLIANFVLRETTPAGQPVPQFAARGINSNADDLLRATGDTLASAGGEKGSAPNLVTMPVMVQTSTVMGTGRAVGTCVDAAAHSEGSPEITTLGSAIAQCSRITTVNGPGVSLEQMQSMADQLALKADRPLQDLSSQNQLNIHTTHLSVTDGLNGGLPGGNTTIDIPNVGMTANHSSIIAMNASEAVGKLSALVNLYNATDKLGEAFNATGDNLPGDLGTAAGYLQLAQGLQSGDNLVIANGINVISDGALDGAMNQAFGTTAAGEAVPYLSYALAVRNFADNPEQTVNDEFFRSAA